MDAVYRYIRRSFVCGVDEIDTRQLSKRNECHLNALPNELLLHLMSRYLTRDDIVRLCAASWRIFQFIQRTKRCHLPCKYYDILIIDWWDLHASIFGSYIPYRIENIKIQPKHRDEFDALYFALIYGNDDCFDVVKRGRFFVGNSLFSEFVLHCFDVCIIFRLLIELHFVENIIP